MGDERPGAEHTPTVTEVPPADSIGRHLCEVTCSCGLFQTTALGRDADTARDDAMHSFDGHLDRAGQADPRPPRPPAVGEPSSTPRRGAPVVALAVSAVVALALGAVLAGVALVGSRNEYAGAPTLVGGPDRTGPAAFATATDSPSSGAHTTERGDRYDDLRAGSPEVKLWSDDRIDQVSKEVCALVRAGRTATEMVDHLAGDGVEADAATVRSLRTFAERFDC